MKCEYVCFIFVLDVMKTTKTWHRTTKTFISRVFCFVCFFPTRYTEVDTLPQETFPESPLQASLTNYLSVFFHGSSGTISAIIYSSSE